MDQNTLGWLLFIASLCWPALLFYGVRRQEKRLNKRFCSCPCPPSLLGNVMSGPTTSWSLYQCPDCKLIKQGPRV